MPERTMHTTHASFELLAGAPERKRGKQAILLLSYNFPPGDSTGALRWQKLVTFAVERGWAVDVITRHPDDLKSTDFRRLDQLPAEVRVFGVWATAPRRRPWFRVAKAMAKRIWTSWRYNKPTSRALAPTHAPMSVPAKADLIWRHEMKAPLTIASLKRAYRAWNFFQDERAWYAAARDAGMLIFDGHSAVVSCGPPHLPHLAARAIASRNSVPFVMDMRDPWSLAPALPSEIGSPVWYSLADKYESMAVKSAKLVVTNTGALGRAMRAKYPEAAERVITVMNGCDDEVIPPALREKFIICYAGNIYIDRDPSLLFRAFDLFVKRHQVSAHEVGIELLGHVDQFGGVSVHAIAEQAGVGEFLTVYPRMPRADALKAMARASVLISLPQEVHLALPSKLFEYMQFPSWVVALAVPGSATVDLLEHTRATIVAPHDHERLAEVFGEQWCAFKSGEIPEPINATGEYDRRKQASRFFEALEDICGSSGHGSEAA